MHLRAEYYIIYPGFLLGQPFLSMRVEGSFGHVRHRDEIVCSVQHSAKRKPTFGGGSYPPLRLIFAGIGLDFAGECQCAQCGQACSG
jgi:hypothetical protein